MRLKHRIKWLVKYYLFKLYISFHSGKKNAYTAQLFQISIFVQLKKLLFWKKPTINGILYNCVQRINAFKIYFPVKLHIITAVPPFSRSLKESLFTE